MHRELTAAYDIAGYAQKDVIKKRIQGVADYLSMIGHPRTGFVQTLTDHFDELGIDWHAPRSQGQINSIVPSIYSAFNMASFMRTGRFPSDVELETPEKCWSTISNVLADPVAGDTFQEESWKLPVTFLPKRVVPLHYTTRHFFGEQPVVMVDLGAGPGFALPSLESGSEITDNVANKDTLQQMLGKAGELSVAHGVSVDKLTREEATLRAKANSNDPKREQMDKLLTGIDKRKFPFVVADLTETDASAAKIASTLATYDSNQADAVVSSFVRYQLRAEEGNQQEFHRLVAMLISEGGIWIDTGEEVSSTHDTLMYGVNVIKNEMVI